VKPSTRSVQMFLFLVGITTSFSFSSVGVVYYGEILMAIVAPWCFLHHCRDRGFLNRAVLIQFGCLSITIVAYIVADLVNQTELDNAIRGWGRLFVIVTNILFLYSLCGDRPVNLRAFCFGTVVGDLTVGVLYDHSGYPWKSAYGVPLTMLLVLAMSAPRRRITGLLGAGVFLALAAVHMILDFRSFSALCLFLSLVFFYSYSNKTKTDRVGLLRMVPVMIVGLGLIYLLYQDSNGLYDGRRRDSNAYRKSGYVTTLAAISRSPLLGSGSWSRESEFQMIFQQTLADEGSSLNAEYEAHSQILQTWYEGGIFATVFLLYLGYQIARSSLYVLRRRATDSLTLLYCFFLILSSWDLFMSPFAGWLRLRVSIMATIVLMLEKERQKDVSIFRWRITRSRVAECTSP